MTSATDGTLKLSWNWLRELVPGLGEFRIDEVVRQLTNKTALVEGTKEVGQGLREIVAGRVLECKPIGDTEEVSYCRLDVGDSQTLSSVVPSPDVSLGSRAVVGLPGGTWIGQAGFEPHENHGHAHECVLLGARDLGIRSTQRGLLELHESVAPGTQLVEFCGLSDVVIEIEIDAISHRPDLWGHRGFAREIAAIYSDQGLTLRLPALERLRAGRDPSAVEINDARCRRYCGVRLSGLPQVRRRGKMVLAPAPLEIQARLSHCGHTAHDIAVDYSTYVMLEFGQPLQAYDARSANHVVVRSLARKRSFTSADGRTWELPRGTLVVCDGKEPISIAGTLVGLESSVNDETSSVFVECASYTPHTVRFAVREVMEGVSTETTLRYASNLPPHNTLPTLRRYVALLRRACPKVQVQGPVTELGDPLPRPKPLRVDLSRLQSLIGEEVSSDETIKKLGALGYDARRSRGQLVKPLDEDITTKLDELGYKAVQKRRTAYLNVRPPESRALENIEEADIVEEIARLQGYDDMRAQPPPGFVLPKPSLRWDLALKTKCVLAESFGFNEIHSYPWVDAEFNQTIGHDPKTVRLKEPVPPHHVALRRELAPALLVACARNRARCNEFRIFEIAATYDPLRKRACRETCRLAMATYSETRDVDAKSSFFELKGMVQALWRLTKHEELTFTKASRETSLPWVHPHLSADVALGGQELGYLTVVHPNVSKHIAERGVISLFDMDFEVFRGVPSVPKRYTARPKYPPRRLDLTLSMGSETTYNELDRSLRDFDDEHLWSFKYKEHAEGGSLEAGVRAVTITVTLGDRSKTLTPEDTAELKKALVAHLAMSGFQVQPGEDSGRQ